MELHELHVLERHAGMQGHGHPVAVARVRIRGHPVDPTHAARREHDRLAGYELQAAAHEIPADDADAAPVLDRETPCEVLLVDVHLPLLHPLHELLVEHVNEDVARDVGRVDGSRRTRGPKRPLRELALLVAREDAAPVLELVDVAGRLVREHLDRVLVSEVVGALDRVVRVRLGAVLGGVPERRVDTALGGPGMAPRRVQLGHDTDARAGVESLDGRPHAGASGPNDHDVVHGSDAT